MIERIIIVHFLETPILHPTGSLSYWRVRADKMRELAEQMKDAINRESMLRMAKHYETIAQRCEGEPSKSDAKQEIH